MFPRTVAGRVALVVALLLIVPACGPPVLTASSLADASPRPDVVMIVLDTLRADRCGVAGGGRGTTPRLDAFAAEATTYLDAWSPAGWTGPAHASLFTGLRPRHHGFLGGRRSVLEREQVTLAEYLGAAGYRRACLAANVFLSPEFGLTQGFEEMPRLGDAQEPAPPASVPCGLALDFCRRRRSAGERFFVFVNAMEPHLSYDPSAADTAAFVPASFPADSVAAARAWSSQDANHFLLGLTTLPSPVAAVFPYLYDAEVAALDRQVGDFLDALRAEGLLDHTLVVILADHGEALGDNGLQAHTFNLHRSICRVPLLIRYPDGAGAGAVVDDVVRLEDVLPTVLEVCHLPAPPDLDGSSLLGPLGGRISRAAWGPQLRLREDVRSHFPGVDPPLLRASIRAVFDGRHHLLVRSDGLVELYDVVADPGETANLAAADPTTVERLRLLLDP